MLRLILILSAIVCVLGAPRSLRQTRLNRGPRIVGGVDVSIEEVPYQLSYEEYFTHMCGAAIISTDWAVTAAQCVESSQPWNVELRSGTVQLERGGAIHQAVEMIYPDDFDIFKLEFDIGLIRVATPFIMSQTTAIIPLARYEPDIGRPAFVSGWGTTYYGSITIPEHLLWAKVPIYDKEDCRTAYKDIGKITDHHVCAGLTEGGSDFCSGDFGDPLVCDGELVGIASWGIVCGAPGLPGVYASVPSMRDWIIENADH